MAAFPKCVAQKVSPVRRSEKRKEKYSMVKYFGQVTLTISWGLEVDISIFNGNIKGPKKLCCKETCLAFG